MATFRRSDLPGCSSEIPAPVIGPRPAILRRAVAGTLVDECRRQDRASERSSLGFLRPGPGDVEHAHAEVRHEGPHAGGGLLDAEVGVNLGAGLPVLDCEPRCATGAAAQTGRGVIASVALRSEHATHTHGAKAARWRRFSILTIAKPWSFAVAWVLLTLLGWRFEFRGDGASLVVAN